jgi:hypothetical protein
MRKYLSSSLIMTVAFICIAFTVASGQRVNSVGPQATSPQSPSTNTKIPRRAVPDPTKDTLDDANAPYPNSVQPSEVLANIKAAVAQSHLAEGMRMPELAMRNGELRVRRLLQVESVEMRRKWLVVELQDLGGHDIANVAITRLGTMMVVEDCRGRLVDRPLSLSEAKNRVRGHRGRDALNAEYVYFNNIAERGLSYTRPLVAVTTERGPIYLNSKAEAFAEEGSGPIAEAGGPQRTRELPVTRGTIRLRSLGVW